MAICINACSSDAACEVLSHCKSELFELTLHCKDPQGLFTVEHQALSILSLTRDLGEGNGGKTYRSHLVSIRELVAV